MQKLERVLRMLVFLSVFAGLIFFAGLYGEYYQRTPLIIGLGQGVILSFAISIQTWYGVASWNHGRWKRNLRQ